MIYWDYCYVFIFHSHHYHLSWYFIQPYWKQVRLYVFQTEIQQRFLKMILTLASFSWISWLKHIIYKLCYIESSWDGIFFVVTLLSYKFLSSIICDWWLTGLKKRLLLITQLNIIILSFKTLKYVGGWSQLLFCVFVFFHFCFLNWFNMVLCHCIKLNESKMLILLIL